MSYELRAADNFEANAEASQAIDGAARYVALVLSNSYGYVPDISTYQYENVPVGKASFWLLSRGDSANAALANRPAFGIIDEGSKWNLNTVAYTNLIILPNVTAEMAASILLWRGVTNDSNLTLVGGATDTVYNTLKPPYYLKGTNFDTVDELRMVYYVTPDVFYGEDVNCNGILDANENDGEATPPFDNRDGKLDFGLAEYFTVYTSDPNTDTNGNARASVNNTNALYAALTNKLSTGTAQNVLNAAHSTNFTSLAQFYNAVSSVLTVADFESVYDSLCVNTNSPLTGQINVNTASPDVLLSLEGFTTDMVNQLVTYRRNNPSSLRTVAWVSSVLGTNIPSSASNLTTHAYQFTADVAAVGHMGRGYRRVRFVIDTSSGTPQIIYRQDLSHLGWALGRDIREQLQNSKDKR
jgi:type II secretory pathway component PulK